MNESTLTQASGTESVDVLIVGGGGAGLTASMLFEKLGVDHLLINARPQTSDLPKAHVLNQRTMEILEDLGVAEEIAERSTPPEAMAATAFYAGFSGSDPGYGRTIAKLEAWGAGGANENWAAASPRVQLNLPQIRLEPILRARAEQLSPGRIRFDQTLIALEQDESGVTATVRDNASGQECEVRARYVLGADGGRTVAGLLGVSYEGLGVITESATMHVSADFSDLAGDPDVLIRWIISPQYGAGVVMVPMGPERWGPDSEEWVIHLTYPAHDPRAQSNEAVEADVRNALGIGELPMEIHKITRWSVDSVIASEFRVGSVFLVGDAAHRHPPTGGLGLNSAIQDAESICWKLAAVLRGDAGEELLDTYEPERRPVVKRNCQRSLENAANHLAVVHQLGVSQESSEQENWAQMQRMFSGDPSDAEHRSRVLRMIREQSMEFDEHNVEYGYAYESAAIVPDGSEPERSADELRIYTPSTHPGSRLPHAWIDDADGGRRPIKDLVRPGRFLLIGGEDAGAWVAAARELAEQSVPIDALRIGHLDGDLFDPRSTWLRHRGISPEGAVLVRPDRFVAWRSLGSSADPEAQLCGVLSQVLATEIATGVLA